MERNGHAAETFFQFPSFAALIPTTVQREQLLGRLLRQYFFIKLVRACAEPQTSETVSRLSAMQSAERNPNDWIE
ncbi:MAG: hypothetical protein NMNS01_14630 [Nitrosomonas sp.]|nr:MAG: hypothetical protein NMNS01_14630 [Nitrosomonas sp.]